MGKLYEVINPFHENACETVELLYMSTNRAQSGVFKTEDGETKTIDFVEVELIESTVVIDCIQYLASKSQIKMINRIKTQKITHLAVNDDSLSHG